MVLQELGSHGWAFWCPGCEEYHRFTDDWDMRDDNDLITVRPSIRTICEGYWNGKEYKALRCHLFITNSRIEYCNDCSHKYAGMTIDMVSLNSLNRVK